ncbi:kinase-like domain-containing protein [Mrakia frigida]|uniref:protein kinase IKS1 n=1 Tax=Mrakia frigida TaxID=29902 RepID=UPI003FCBF0EA
MSRGTLLIPAGDWQTVLHTPTSLVLYNPPSHALTVLPHPFPSGPSTPRSLPEGGESTDGGETTQDDEDEVEESLCPYCKRPMADAEGGINIPSPSPSSYPYTQPTARYFSILSQANTPVSTPRPRRASSSSRTLFRSSPASSAFVDEYESDEPIPSAAPSSSSARLNGNGNGGGRKRRSRRAERVVEEELEEEEGGLGQNGADGYYERFFKEEGRLGMGAQGTVFLCQHLLDNQPLGLYAVKKVAVGESHDYLIKVLREVQLLQTLRHENIVTYHHAWIERTRFSSFGPKVQALHILMQFASSGSLEDFILTRTLPSPTTGDAPLDAFHLAELSPEEAKAAIRARRSSKGVVAGGGKSGGMFGTGKNGGGGGERRAVRLLGREEVEGVFGGIVKGLGYLHDHGILHLDLKCSNVLLHQEEGDLIPRALISDFGTSRAVVYGGGREGRSGNTGTMEYCAPESLMVDREGRLMELGREGDLWSLGMVLYKLLFFKLPYSQIEDFDLLASDIKAYPGFHPTPALIASFQRRGLPRELLHILSGLLNVDPRKRPSCEQVLTILQSGMKDDAFHFPEYYDEPDTEPDPSKRLAPFVPHPFGPLQQQEPPNLATGIFREQEEEDGGFGLRSLSRTASEGSFDSVRTETPAQPLSPLVPFTNLPPLPIPTRPLLAPSKSRILLPPPYRRPPHPLVLLLLRHLPSLLVLAKFLSLYVFLPRAPSLGLQVAVLALALAGRGRGERGGRGRGCDWDWETMGLGIGHLVLMVAFGEYGFGERWGLGWGRQ